MSTRAKSKLASVLLLAGVVTFTAACSSGSDSAKSSNTPTQASTDAATINPAPKSSSAVTPGSLAPSSPAITALAAMDLNARVGQLFMAGTSSTQTDSAALDAITNYHVGGIILNGNSDASVQDTLVVASALQKAYSAQNKAGSPHLLISTDQEGGQVQRLRGPGFERMPTGLEQGKMSAAALKPAAQRWGTALKSAGVNMNLCPVLDTVPSAAFAPSNPPIGGFDRQFGYDPPTVQTHGIAAIDGYTQAGIVTSAKHFPGLGRVTGNTDTTSGVTDTTTTTTDPYLAPFRAAIADHVPAVMMATAIYSRIDSAEPAAFSRQIVTDLLRTNMGFTGVVISDDLGAAEQVASVPMAERATKFIAAGGDIVLTVDPANVRPMASAVIAQAQKDPAFKAQIDAAALRVLTMKQRFNLL